MSTPWGQGRIEVKNCREEIPEAVVSGRTLSAVYDDLIKNSRISITYKSFWQNATHILDSSNKRAQSSRGAARTEVISLSGQIRSALNEGRTLKAIYDELKAEGRVSSRYDGGFYKNVKKFCGSPSPRPDLSSASSANTSSQSSPLPSPKSSPGVPPAKRNGGAPGSALPPERADGGERTFEYDEFKSLDELEKQYAPEGKETAHGSG